MLRQTAFITVVNLLSIPSRIGTSLVMFVGIAAVVGVITSMLALTEGLAATLGNTANEGRVVILSENARYVGGSSLAIDDVNFIASAPGIARTREGQPAVSKDARVSIMMTGRTDGVRQYVVVRGMSPAGWNVRPEIRLLSGRPFTPGLDEVIVGRGVQSQYTGTDVGDKVLLATRQMRIVGVFESGDWVESGFLTDADTLLAAYERTATNAVNVRLEDPGAVDILKTALAKHPANFQVVSEPEYYSRVIEGFSLQERVTKLVSWILAIGAFLCVFNVMYAAVDMRDREIASWRAMGFSGSCVACSVVAETILVALAGAIAGCALSWVLFNGNVVTTGGANASVVHQVAVDAEITMSAVVMALSIALLGALVPAIQAARTPLTTLLRRF